GKAVEKAWPVFILMFAKASALTPLMSSNDNHYLLTQVDNDHCAIFIIIIITIWPGFLHGGFYHVIFQSLRSIYSCNIVVLSPCIPVLPAGIQLGESIFCIGLKVPGRCCWRKYEHETSIVG